MCQAHKCRRALRIVCALLLSAPVYAQDEEPGLDFLEYLGSWEEGDEAWYVDSQIDEADEETTRTQPENQELRAERNND